MNPADFLKKGVAKLNDWFEKTDRDELEQRQEILRGPDGAPHPRGRRDPDGSNLVSLEDSGQKVSGIAEVVPAPPRRPAETAPPSFQAEAMSQSNQLPDSRAQPGELNRTPTGDAFVAGKTDTQYRERNLLVRKIGQLYSRFGDGVASAILQKSLLPDGVQMLATKLGLEPQGDDELDHLQIVDFLEQQGVEKFCEVVGVRITTPSPMGGLTRSSRGESDKLVASGENMRVAQNMANNGRVEGESPILQLQRVNVKPVTLNFDESDAEAEDRDSQRRDQTPEGRRLAPEGIEDRPAADSPSPAGQSDPTPGSRARMEQGRQLNRPQTESGILTPNPRLPPPSNRPKTEDRPAPPRTLKPVSLRGQVSGGDATPSREMEATLDPLKGRPITHSGEQPNRAAPPTPQEAANPLKATPLPKRPPNRHDQPHEPAQPERRESTAERKAADFLRQEMDSERFFLDDD